VYKRLLSHSLDLLSTMDYLLLAAIPVSLVLPHFFIATIIFIFNRNLSNKFVLISSSAFFIGLIIAASFFPKLHSGEQITQSNLLSEWLKLSFFGKGNKIVTLQDNGIEYPYYVYYSGKLFFALISAWFTLKIYLMFNWLLRKMKTSQPAQI